LSGQVNWETTFSGNWLTLLVFGFAGRRSDPGTEPGFDGDPPQGGQTSVIMLRRSSDHPFKVLEKQPENDFTPVTRGRAIEAKRVNFLEN
jgi:hypothetical protein